MKKFTIYNLQFTIFAYLFASLLICLLPSRASAAPNEILRLSPLIFNISLSPGKEYVYEMDIKNLTNTPLPVRAYLENFTTTDEEGGYTFENTSPNPLLSWIKISDPDMIIPAKKDKTIKITVKIPTKIPFGGYYGVLFLEPLISQKTTNNTLVSAKVGALFLANVGVTSKDTKAQILDFSPEFLNQSNKIPYLLRVQNNGLNHFSAKPQIIIKSLFGKEKIEDIEEKFIFPGKVRRWEQNILLSNNFKGIYKAEVYLSIGEGKQLIKTAYFVSFPISKSLAIVLIVSILLFTYFKRKNIKKAIFILVKGSK